MCTTNIGILSLNWFLKMVSHIRRQACYLTASSIESLGAGVQGTSGNGSSAEESARRRAFGRVWVERDWCHTKVWRSHTWISWSWCPDLFLASDGFITAPTVQSHIFFCFGDRLVLCQHQRPRQLRNLPALLLPRTFPQRLTECYPSTKI